ncbi:MAG TPA: hypothetical protein VGB65_10960 [Allosphingosinicella sp.]
MKRLIVAGALAMAATPALAQPAAAPADPAKKPVWSGGVELSFSPRIGKQQPFGTSEELIDESEGELSVSIKRTNTVGRLPLQLKAGISTSPQYFDEGDPESGYFGEITVGDAFIPLTTYLVRGTAEKTDAVSDARRPYARYRYTRIHNGFLDGFARDEHQATLGFRFRNVVTIMCDVADLPPADEEACSKEPGVSFEVRTELNRIWSSDRNEERFAPQVRLDITSRRLWGGARIFGRGQIEARFYDHARAAATGKRREDWRLRLTGGVDVSEAVARAVPGAELELAAQFQRRWSSDETKEHSRFYFVPALTFSLGF